MELAIRIHQLTRTTPSHLRFSFAEQLSRSAVSIPSNIAEGVGRPGRREYRRHVGIAPASWRELETQLLLGVQIEAFKEDDAAESIPIAAEVGRMLAALGKRLS